MSSRPTAPAAVEVGSSFIARLVNKNVQPPLMPVLTNQTKSFEYGWTARNLQQCLVDHLTELTQYELFKCPSGGGDFPPTVTMTPPFIYAAYIPASIVSPQGSQDPPIVPSILIELHTGEVTLPRQPNYLIGVRLLISVWDDDPTYQGWMDSQHLTEKVFLYLLKYRSLSERYNLTGKISWSTIRDNRANYFVSMINMTYDLDMPPDAFDNVDSWMLEDNHRIYGDTKHNLSAYPFNVQTVDAKEYSYQELLKDIGDPNLAIEEAMSETNDAYPIVRGGEFDAQELDP